MICEGCWEQACCNNHLDVTTEYNKLINNCTHTPHQKAGKDAQICPVCMYFSIHQHTKTCVICGHKK